MKRYPHGALSCCRTRPPPNWLAGAAFDNGLKTSEDARGEGGCGEAEEERADEGNRAVDFTTVAPSNQRAAAVRIELDVACRVATAKRAGCVTRDGELASNLTFHSQGDGLAAAEKANAETKGCGEGAVRTAGDALGAGHDPGEDGRIEDDGADRFGRCANESAALGPKGLHADQGFVRRARAALSRRSGRAMGQASCTKPFRVFTRLSGTCR